MMFDAKSWQVGSREQSSARNCAPAQPVAASRVRADAHSLSEHSTPERRFEDSAYAAHLRYLHAFAFGTTIHQAPPSTRRARRILIGRLVRHRGHRSCRRGGWCGRIRR